MYRRKLLDVKNKKVPATISLLGCDSKFYLGIKVTLFDPIACTEDGFFLTVNQKSWELSESEKSMLPKKTKTRQEPLLEHYKLPKFLKGIGGDEIFRNMEAKSRKEI